MMPCKVITITSGKGGVGKTTTTANIGTGLAMAGHQVCLIDADIGLRNLDVVLGLENRIVYDITHVAAEQCRLKQALIRDKRTQNLFLLPAPQTKEKDAISPEEMRSVVDMLREEFDYILVDSPAGIEHGFRNAIAGADAAIVVTTPEVAAVRDADRIIGLLEAAEIREHWLVLNRVRPDMVRRGDMMGQEDVLEFLAIDLLGVVPDDENIIVSTNRGEPVILESKSKSGQAYRNIVRRIKGEDVPFMSLEEDSFLQRIKRVIAGYSS